MKKLRLESLGVFVLDVAQCYADPDYAFEVLGWKAELGIERMCEDAWRWQSKNPNGYR
ncbi:hypothetical protein [Thiomicrospira sp. ALE5]|uniref:hypothetical protein n=1 Tax=Thiomicrospira sp. ALE5 TaxID=748650 RepID=UPI000AE6B535|nr:hypothetical protein [Thiomicrospira sp. ALE5]